MAKKPIIPMLNLERTPHDIRRGIKRINHQIQELEDFDTSIVARRGAAEVNAIQVSIQETLESVFGIYSPDYKKYESATRLDNGPMTMQSDWIAARGGYQAPEPFHQYLDDGKQNALAMLNQARKRLKADLSEQVEDSGEEQLNDVTELPSLKQFDDDSLVFANNDPSIFSIAFIDIDNFKALNAEIGHDNADDIIRTLAKLLKQITRGRAKVYHRSGDEFLLHLDNTTAEEASGLLTRVIQTVQATAFPHIDRGLSISIGVVCYPEGSQDLSGLKTLANHAMMSAKKAGKGRVCIFRN